MKRVTLVLVAVLMASLTAWGPASARTITVRTDPNDTHGLDLRKVWSNLRPSSVFVRVGVWERLRGSDGQFSVLLDTRGSLDYDRIVEISGAHPSCVVEKLQDGFLGDFIGQRHGTRGRRTVTCHMPTGWFGIRKVVRFAVVTGTAGAPHDDRAPNQGRYIGL